jgi:hypothetical protein
MKSETTFLKATLSGIQGLMGSVRDDVTLHIQELSDEEHATVQGVVFALTEVLGRFPTIDELPEEGVIFDDVLGKFESGKPSPRLETDELAFTLGDLTDVLALCRDTLTDFNIDTSGATPHPLQTAVQKYSQARNALAAAILFAHALRETEDQADELISLLGL